MTHPLVSQCDPKYDWMAYIRVGLYVVTRRGERKNFCDIHFGGMPEELRAKFFSGPKDAISQVKRIERSKEEQLRYFREGTAPGLDIAKGGYALSLPDAANKNVRVWLLGPLVFNKVAYGSLVADLNDMVMPKTRFELHERDPKTGEKRKNSDPKRSRFYARFPRNYGQYLPCTLWGSDYSEGGEPLPLDNAKGSPRPALNDLLRNATNRVHPAILPDGAAKIVWRAEDFRDQLTMCEYVRRGG